MRLSRETKDVYMTDDYDLHFGENGDFRIAKESLGEVSVQMIQKRSFSKKGDWKANPDCGADLPAFFGRSDIYQSVQLAKSAIQSELTKELCFNPNNFQVNVIPVSSSYLTVVVLCKTEYMETPVVVSQGLSFDSFNRVSNPLRGR